MKPTRSFYKTPRARAWRNVMVATINAGLDQGLFSLEPGDNRWLGEAKHGRKEEAHVFAFTCLHGIPALSYVADIGWDELSIRAALWPTKDGDRFVRASNGGFRAGDDFAAGWLERQRGPYLQTSPSPTFKCRHHLLPSLAGATVEPEGYADQGRFMP